MYQHSGSMAWSLILAEEIARARATQVLQGGREERRARVETRLQQSIQVDGRQLVLLLEEPGLLKELAIISNTPDFSVQVYADGEPILDGSFKYLESISPAIPSVAAVQNNGYSIVSVADVEFREKLEVYITARGAMIDVHHKVLRR